MNEGFEQVQCQIQKIYNEVSPSLERSTVDKKLHSLKNVSPDSIFMMTILRASLAAADRRNTDSGVCGQILCRFYRNLSQLQVDFTDCGMLKRVVQQDSFVFKIVW